MPQQTAIAGSVSAKPVRSTARLGLTVLLAASLLAGCGVFNSSKEADPTVGWSAEQLYRDAKDELDSGNWAQARTQLERVQSRYPFGLHAQQAMIDTAYVYWKENSPEQALATIDRFQQQYPNNEAMDYMLYLKGLINFTPEGSFISNLVGEDFSQRDPRGARASYDAFADLIKRYPDSRYAEDARLRMNWLVNNIAMNEVHTARYYYERRAYVAAINRSEMVINDFQGSPATEEALYIMMLSYDRLAMPELRDDTRRVLIATYPNSAYLQSGFQQPGGKWWNPFSW